MHLIRILILPIIWSLPLAVFAQASAPESSSAQFRGVVVDSKPERISKASILIEGANRRWNLESDESGEFKLDLPAGKYKFTIGKPHFKRLIVLDFCIVAGSKVSYEFQMELGECSDCDRIAAENQNMFLQTRRLTTHLTRAEIGLLSFDNLNACFVVCRRVNSGERVAGRIRSRRKL